MSVNEQKKRSTIHPNHLTLYRILAIPGIVILMLYPDHRLCTFLSALLFSTAAITDYLDGYLARTRGLVTDFGKFIDPLADKLLISSALVMLASYQRAPGWIVCVIISREFIVTGLRSVADHTKEDLSSSWLGKYKTGFQIAAIIPLLIHYSYFGVNLHVIGMFFLWGALLFTLWSGIDYYMKYKKFLQI